MFNLFNKKEETCYLAWFGGCNWSKDHMCYGYFESKEEISNYASENDFKVLTIRRV